MPIALGQDEDIKDMKGGRKMSLVRWNPRQSLMSLPSALDDFFRGFGLNFEEQDRIWMPIVDVAETEDAYEIKAEIPGLKKEDIKISLEEGMLTLQGEKKEEKEKEKRNYHRIERVYGAFHRSFRLPREVEADKIKARYEDGILSVVIPKSEKLKPKQIAVS
ncbi:MAG TPA: Hsp20/alpha crystallin family protein [bacterium]|nr:Hsp20/alpha crystallin family protein [bacterium]